MPYNTLIHTAELMLEKISYFFGSLIRNHPTSKELSKIINSLLDDPNTEIKLLGDYSVLLGSVCLWVGNYPYAYGNVCTIATYQLSDEIIKFNVTLYRFCGTKLPDRKTVYRLHKVVSKLQVEHKKQQLEEVTKLFPELGELK
jgi:hypothetical protein